MAVLRTGRHAGSERVSGKKNSSDTKHQSNFASDHCIIQR